MTPIKHSRLAVLLAVAFVTITGSRALAQPARLAVQTGFPSLLLLVVEDTQGQPLALGSGFVVRPGLVATNRHVVVGASRGWAKFVNAGRHHDIEGVVASDDKNDLVLLSVPGTRGSPVLRLGDSNSVAIGDEVFALGNPLGLEGTISSGIVSGRRSTEGRSLLQITAPISPGSSGGPVLNTKGQVIGVAVATFLGGQNLNFVVPAQHLAALMDRTPHALQPLRSLGVGRARRAPKDPLGDAPTAAVVATHVDCFKPDVANSFMDWDCSFSIQNKLRSPVQSVRALFILWARDGSALDVQDVYLPGPIRPGLALRTPAFAVKTGIRRITTRMEARILDFRVLE